MSTEKEYSKSCVPEFMSKLQELNTLLCTYQENTFMPELWDAQSRISVLWELATSPEEKYQCIEIAAMLPDDFLRKTSLNQLGFHAYEHNEFNYAAHAFMRSAQMGDIGAKNNFAYLLRKELCDCSSFYAPLDLLKILQPGLKAKEPLSVVNTALVLALLLGTDFDWEVADRLISCLDDISGVASWWETIGKNGDQEGHLVHLWLLRHKLITESPLGSSNELFDDVCKVYRSVPAWLASVKAIENESTECTESSPE